ncbi:hypothetical protein A2334_03870 [Candidatus Roizmanbacteria bacterium RIFOXYB2_FULL_38_10]|uniref:Gas vesicle protein n=1 Tax=Candidatus Roizmanbacteria bacterium RIFOXYD1_FULL_38_12 TaxID=1802093 RepID=A0A1F7L1H2_9BACT|nr:MAG: hypothetical protein A3K47_04015 [Candidatus Roizmanbacteria bacterium RIFOXYA2_FULL_38_14]OGK63923.1 MAG: hypothetical protein A3K27_04015 [Candidatus Roizmanbacteria bacterium RIFOXYA1_FULL_37_12]OGK65769.1 MAG: hypothetical protein A3K38_04015 [Candidatus Roizmanbacteria bacterium RIFOXYB1_FULL_40_23]OGK68463.1 MAG: hypothetical protein A2334_03870 [Candidatus Roizmanbacteria bacterium RIFOXYB2_FULL_38_10]OGK70174.1 MAG: hypothetical protein A3K21_04020 [Candidatus Roizmanbacteria ba
MATDQKSSKFGIGLFIGTLLGGLTALFLSPTSGEENRKLLAKKIKELEKMLEEEHIDKKVKEIFGEVTEEARDLYLKTKKELIKRLSELKETIEHIDREKYETVVKETVDIIKKEAKKEGKEMEKLKEALLKEWKKLEGKKK